MASVPAPGSSGKPGVIAITGTLSPARGGETIVVSKRAGRSSHWLYQNVTVASSGRFSVFTQVTRTTAFVAQWAGDDQRVGAGTPALEIGIGKRFTRDRSLVVRSALRTMPTTA